MDKRFFAVFLVVCILMAVAVGIGFRAGDGGREQSDGTPSSSPSSELEDMTAELTEEEKTLYAKYLNMVTANGVDVYFWLDNGEIVGTLRPTSASGQAVSDTVELRRDPLTLTVMRKILRSYADTRVFVRDSDGLNAAQLNEAKGICIIP